MKKLTIISSLALLLVGGVEAQNTKISFTPGHLAVLRAGNGVVNANLKQTPAFIDEFDPTNNDISVPLQSVAIPTNGTGALFFNEQAGSEGGMTRSMDRTALTFGGYCGGNMGSIPGTPSKVGYARGFCTVDAFTNYNFFNPGPFWFGITAGQTNPRDNVTDGTNDFWGIGSSYGMIFLKANGNYAQVGDLAALSAGKIINGTLYVTVSSGDANATYPPGLYTLEDFYNNPLPLPEPDSTEATYLSPFLTAQAPYTKIVGFDINPAGTIAYVSETVYGIQKYVKSGGGWRFAYNFSNLALTNGNNYTTIINGTTTNLVGGCYGLVVDWSGTNPVIYATTTEGWSGNVNSNRVIRVVDTNSLATAATVAKIYTPGVTNGVNMGFRGLDFTPDLRPLITSWPGGFHEIAAGDSISFNIGVSSPYALTYQWQENGANLPGQTTASLTVNTSLSDAGTTNYYQCVVTNQYYAVTSAPPIQLSIVASPIQPVINPPVQNFTNAIGDTVVVTVSATGTEPLGYQWYLNGVQLNNANEFSGVTTPTISINNAQLGVDDGTYSCIVSNSAGTVSNAVATVKLVHLPPIFVSMPSSTTVIAGSSGSMSASVFGEAPFSLSCYAVSNSVTIPLSGLADYSTSVNGPNLTLSLNNAQVSDAFTNIYFVASNAGGSVTSSPVSVTIFTAPYHTFVSYTSASQVYSNNFDSLPVPSGQEYNTAAPLTMTVITNKAGKTLSYTYSLGDPFDFGYPIIASGGVGGLGLGASTNMPGWYGWGSVASKLGAQQGGQTTGGIISFGAYYGSSSSNAVNNVFNRALGLLATSTSGQTAFGLALVNNGNTTLNAINLSFVGELWHQQAIAQNLQFGYLVDPAGTNSSFTAQTNPATTWVPSLNVTGFPTGGSGAVDGTASINQTNIAAANLALSTGWTPGSALWLVWTLTNSAGGAQGIAIDNLSFSAAAGTPTVTILTVSNITASSATLDATVNPNGGATAYWFQYGTNTGYGGFTPTNAVGSGSSPVTVTNLISGLRQGTVYHYQIVATNLSGLATNLDASFATLTVTPPQMDSVKISSGSGALQFSFTNATGASFSVLATNDMTIPRTNWPVVGHAIESPAGSGNYQFTNSAPATNAQTFYILRQP